MTSSEVSSIERALDALDDGDTDLATDLLMDVVATRDRDGGRCRCGRWPGEQWKCGPCSRNAS
jgi:hypothetical protein